MIAKESRVFVYDGKEYRIAKDQPVGDFPKEVLDKMVQFKLVEDDRVTEPAPVEPEIAMPEAPDEVVDEAGSTEDSTEPPAVQSSRRRKR